MNIFKRLFGSQEESAYTQRSSTARERATSQLGLGATTTSLSDEQALARYRYMLRTAPPEAIEQAHEEAFAKLTPEQRSLALRELATTLPANEQPGQHADPHTLARVATRAELRQPGTMERVLGGGGGMSGMGMGGMIAGTMLGSLVAGFVGSMIAEQFFDNAANFDDFATDTSEGDPAEAEMDQGIDSTENEASGGWEDAGGDFGDFGGFEGEV